MSESNNQTISLLNYKGDASSLYLQGDAAFESFGVNTLNYLGLIALESGGRVSFDWRHKQRLNAIRIVWSAEGGHIEQVIVNEAAPDLGAKEAVAIDLIEDKQNATMDWRYARKNAPFKHFVYTTPSESRANRHNEITQLIALAYPHYVCRPQITQPTFATLLDWLRQKFYQ